MKSTGLLATSLLAAGLLASCNGLFGGLYDDPQSAKDLRYGFISEDADRQGGTIYLDLRAYDRWTYIDLHQQTVDTANVAQQQEAPHQWDIALHRYDASTHMGAAAESEVNNLDYVADLASLGPLKFEADADSQVVVDITHMMDGVLGYAPAQVNPVLSRWMDVDMNSMPPTYTPSERVYVVRLADGTHAALQFTRFTNDAGTKGYVTIRYRYPL